MASATEQAGDAAVAVRSALMFTMRRPPSEGLLTLKQGRVVAVGKNDSGRPPVDLGDVGILPGLINAHAHLEFSDLQSPLGRPGMPLPSWIEAVVQLRRSAAQDAQPGAARRAAIEGGLRESGAAGVAHVGDVVTLPWQSDWLAAGAVDQTAFLELLTLDPSLPLQLISEAARHLQQGGDGRWRGGVSPHAPYSAHPLLVESACHLSSNRQAPLAMHLAESREELLLLATGAGPFRDMLQSLGAWRDDAIPNDCRPLMYLELLQRADRALVIHGNYLNAPERDFIAQHRPRMSLVYCPRTHAYFEHDPYPLADLLRRGVLLALGTDSRASSPDLSVWSELQWAADRHGDVPPQRLLEMVTCGPAEALGLPHHAGRICPGSSIAWPWCRWAATPARTLYNA